MESTTLFVIATFVATIVKVTSEFGVLGSVEMHPTEYGAMIASIIRDSLDILLNIRSATIR